MIHYSIIKLTLPVITGTCTAQGNPSTGTPLTCVDSGAGAVTDHVYKFTNYIGHIPESGIYKQIKSISETTPELKGGADVASRASISIVFDDFIDDPNMDSEALRKRPEIRKQGTFFGKLNERQIINNKEIAHEYWKTDGFTHTLVKTHYFYGSDFTKTGPMAYAMKGEDILERISGTKRSFPNDIYEKLVSDITETSTSITITKNTITDHTLWLQPRIAVLGNDLLVVTNSVDNGSDVTLTVERETTVRIGDGGLSITIPLVAGAKIREITNEPQAAKAGDSVFFPKVYGNVYKSNGDLVHSSFVGPLPESNPARLIDDILTSQGFSGKISDFSSISKYLPNSEMYTIYYNPNGALDSIKEVVRTYLIDVFTDLENDEIAITSTSPWTIPVRNLIEGRDFDYLSDMSTKSEDLRFSRTTLYYSKQRITDSDDKVNFRRVSLSKDETLEGSDFYGEQKNKELGNTILLGNTDRDIELADTATIRHTRRFGKRPEKLVMTMSEDQLGDLKISNVVTINGKSTTNEFGRQASKSFQISKIQPRFDIARTYTVNAISYNSDGTTIGNSTIYVDSTSEVNLFLLAESPESAITRTFVFDGQTVTQASERYSIQIGSFASGSTINIVMLNGAKFMARGGYGGDGVSQGLGGRDGGDGGTVLFGQSGVTVNIYMDGTATIDSNAYTFEGYIFAPGGGGGSGASEDGPSGAGGGGAGAVVGNGGISVNGSNGQDGTDELGGSGGFVPVFDGGHGGAGGDLGEDGVDGDDASIAVGGIGGAAGKAISVNSGTFKLYGAVTNVNYIIGNGDTGPSVQLLAAPT